MFNPSKYVEERIRRRYLLGLGLIVLIAAASAVLTVIVIQRHYERLHLVDYAAQQLSLSQRLAFLVNKMAGDIDDSRWREYRSALERDVKTMAEGHAVLNLSTPHQHVPTDVKVILRDLYYLEPQPLDVRVERFLRSARQILNTKRSELSPDLPSVERVTRLGTGPLMESFQFIYGRLRTVTLDALVQCLWIAGGLWVLTVVIVIIEIPLIFRPMAVRAGEQLSALDAARQQAESEAAESRKVHEDNVTFMRLMNHELRTPLNAVMGMAALLRMSKLTEKQDEYAQQIQASAERLFRQINLALDFRELEADLVRLRKSRILLRDELERVCTVFRPLMVEKGLEMNCTVDERCAGPFLADSALVRQALTHLVSNALKFTDEGVVTVRALRDGEVAGRDLVRFEVLDTGIGVPPGLREQIFEEWRQAEGTLSRKHGGLGLGLAIARRLVQLMEGEIGVECLDGMGSLFWFTLPLERAAASEQPEGMEKACRLRPALPPGSSR